MNAMNLIIIYKRIEIRYKIILQLSSSNVLLDEDNGKFFFFSTEPLQSKQGRVTFGQNDESNERYECAFAAYLEV
jgi:hypothetical protein